MVGGGWRLAAVGGWRLAVGRPSGQSLRAVLNKKNLGPKGPPCQYLCTVASLRGPALGAHCPHAHTDRPLMNAEQVPRTMAPPRSCAVQWSCGDMRRRPPPPPCARNARRAGGSGDAVSSAQKASHSARALSNAHCLPPTEQCSPSPGQPPAPPPPLPGSHSALPLGCIRRAGTSEAAPEAVRQAVGGGCQSGWGRLLSVTNAIEGGT